MLEITQFTALVVENTQPNRRSAWRPAYAASCPGWVSVFLTVLTPRFVRVSLPDQPSESGAVPEEKTRECESREDDELDDQFDAANRRQWRVDVDPENDGKQEVNTTVGRP